MTTAFVMCTGSFKKCKDVRLSMTSCLSMSIFLFPLFFMKWHPYIPLDFREMIFPLVRLNFFIWVKAPKKRDVGTATAKETIERRLKSVRVHLAAGSVEVKTSHSNAHVSNICGRAKCACCVRTPGIRALAYFRYCIPAVKRTPRTLLMRHTANFVSPLRRNSRSG